MEQRKQQIETEKLYQQDAAKRQSLQGRGGTGRGGGSHQQSAVSKSASMDSEAFQASNRPKTVGNALTNVKKVGINAVSNALLFLGPAAFKKAPQQQQQYKSSDTSRSSLTKTTQNNNIKVTVAAQTVTPIINNLISTITTPVPTAEEAKAIQLDFSLSVFIFRLNYYITFKLNC